MARTKKWWWIHASAGVVSVLLLAGLCGTCSSANSKDAELEKKKADFKEAINTLENANNAIKDLQSENAVKDSIIEKQSALWALAETEKGVLCDSIDVLNDSIDGLNEELKQVNADLEDCRKSKKSAVKKPAVKKSEQKKTAPKKQEQKKSEQKKPEETKPVVVPVSPVKVVKPDTVYVVVEQPRKDCAGGKTKINLDNSDNNGAVVVGKQCVQDTEITLQNGSVNNGAIVVGSNNHVVIGGTQQQVVDTLRRIENASKAYGYYKVKRVVRRVR